MLKSIIPTPRCSELWIAGLIDMGILEVTADGLCCREPSDSEMADGTNAG
ncbi:MAG: hypothetical protein NC094_09050 [Bacteroidales bacterium]|nr:hypothetical protein [Lachnoclostridium sp.]MCM1385151.1 hypothetical protein [Lachnoclostridium sp.]MCM1465553.1 hypothetical protein [Bacteroidales bacterium]